MYQYLGSGLFLVEDWHQDSNFEPVDVDVLEDSHWARLDAVSRKAGKPPVSKSKCNPKPTTNSKGAVIRPATFPCGSVCRQKQNCGLSKSEEATIARRTKGLGEQELRKAIVLAKRKKRQGKLGAVYEATSDALSIKGKQRQEQRRQKSVTAAEKRKSRKAATTKKRKPASPSKPTKIYTSHSIVDREAGTVTRTDDGRYMVRGVNTNSSQYISIGKFVSKKDEFGDEKTQWEHYEYPKNFEMGGLNHKREYKKNWSKDTSSVWSFKIPPQFTEEGFGLAVVESGRSKEIAVFFDRDRLERMAKGGG